jgi:hypothetical protein
MFFWTLFLQPLEGNNVNQVQSVPIKKQAQEKDPIFSAKKKPTVLYIGHIPHGFFEDQMRGKNCFV